MVARAYAFSTGTEWLPAHRPFKKYLFEFWSADKYNGKTNLRFDDTNPEKEEQEYVNSIREDIKWLGLNGRMNFMLPITSGRSMISL